MFAFGDAARYTGGMFSSQVAFTRLRFALTILGFACTILGFGVGGSKGSHGG